MQLIEHMFTDQHFQNSVRWFATAPVQRDSWMEYVPVLTHKLSQHYNLWTMWEGNPYFFVIDKNDLTNVIVVSRIGYIEAHEEVTHAYQMGEGVVYVCATPKHVRQTIEEALARQREAARYKPAPQDRALH